jgi:uncharacterized LabA/DUF88 family protein
LSKNVAVFVDVANIFYAAKAAGVDIDYVTLLKASSAGRDLVRAYAYTGLDPDNENQRNFHDFLRRHGYKVVSKDIRKYGDGKVKANLDIELVVDMMKTARNLDIAIVVSGDGDFAPAIRAVQEMGVRVEVVSFRGNTSSDLIDVADQFTDIIQVAKVEKGTSRSGRRVATDDEDLSMTEVPDKMTEGTGDGRRRGRGSRTRTPEPVAARPSRAAATRRTPVRVEEPEEGDGTLVVLPGEKLSRAARPAAAAGRPVDAAAEDLEPEDELAIVEGAEEGEETGEAGEGGLEGALGEDGLRRRRRRRGGRGRGRGRGRGELGEVPAGAEPVAAADEADVDVEDVDVVTEQPAPRKAAFSFGSVWDSQLGVPSSTGRTATPSSAGPGDVDDEDLEEPAIPEYLIAERRQRDARGNRGRGPVRGGRGGAYAAAMDRERFGAGRGATPSRFAEPAPRRDVRDSGGVRSGGPSRPPRMDRPDRMDRPEPRSSSGDPWSEVPPEIEAMLRAQLASGGGRQARPGGPAPMPRSTGPGTRRGAPEGEPTRVAAADAAATPAAAPARRGSARGGRTGASPKVEAVTAGEPGSGASSSDAAAPKAPRRRTTTAKAAGADASAPATKEAAAAKPVRRRATAKAASASGADAAGTADAATGDATAAPKRRTTRKKADSPD